MSINENYIPIYKLNKTTYAIFNDNNNSRQMVYQNADGGKIRRSIQPLQLDGVPFTLELATAKGRFGMWKAVYVKDYAEKTPEVRQMYIKIDNFTDLQNKVSKKTQEILKKGDFVDPKQLKPDDEASFGKKAKYIPGDETIIDRETSMTHNTDYLVRSCNLLSSIVDRNCSSDQNKKKDAEDKKGSSPSLHEVKGWQGTTDPKFFEKHFASAMKEVSFDELDGIGLDLDSLSHVEESLFE